MTIQPIDLSAVLSVVFGGLFVLIPTIALTFRFALKPVLEAIAGARAGRPDLDQLAQRVAALELQMQAAKPSTQLPPRISPVADLPAGESTPDWQKKIGTTT